MALALFISFAMIIASLVAAAGFLGLAVKSLNWLPTNREAQSSWVRLTTELCVTSLWILLVMTASIWAWALLYIRIGLFPNLEEALYFSIVSFTTVGYGDVIIEGPWRVIAGMTAAHGLLSFGLYTAFFVETLDFPRRGRGSTRQRLERSRHHLGQD
ncbi:potassium channel family protein [Pseudaestuariivita atlantica]|uniref:potassium channel family protein n=1 Tax=Pseudaestuariivita atlantica TaxID=1317121 RepID=UPI00067BBEDA|nr:potassium channel family protein [Pseudaestuariivita atlantica]